MKVLYIFDIGRNSFLLAQKLKRLNQQAIVLTRKNGNPSLIVFLLQVIFYLLSFHPDLVHINFWAKGVLFARFLSPRSQILMHYYGSDIRGKTVSRYVQRYSHCIAFSTTDIFKQCQKGILLPSLISEEFYYRGGREEGTVLMLEPGTFNIEYELMPYILSLGEYYYDNKRKKRITNSLVLSKTAREALACGTKVITQSGELVTDFPQISFQEYFQLYNQMVELGKTSK